MNDPLSISKMSGSQVIRNNLLKGVLLISVCMYKRQLVHRSNQSINQSINQSDSKPSTMAKTTEMSMDVREKIKIYTMLEAAWWEGFWQQLVRLISIYSSFKRRNRTKYIQDKGRYIWNVNKAALAYQFEYKLVDNFNNFKQLMLLW